MKTVYTIVLVFGTALTIGQNLEVQIDDHKDCIDRWMASKKINDLRFDREKIAWWCEKGESWSIRSKLARNKRPETMLTTKQKQWLFRIRSCQIPQCPSCGPDEKCQSIPQVDLPKKQEQNVIEAQFQDNNQKTLKGDFRVQRKEIRQMADDEWERFSRALNRVKMEKIDGTSMYDLLIMQYSPQESPGAHWGPAFLPFHREWLKQLELAIRRFDWQVSIPYWDTTLDQGLPSPQDSIVWTGRFFGNGNGEVISGPFSWWNVTDRLELVPKVKALYRDVGTSSFGGLLKEEDIKFTMSRKSFEDLTACVDPTFEIVHEIVHLFVGGYMADVSTSPNDPIFFLYHCFIDLIWEQWRLIKQTPEIRQSYYPSEDLSCNNFNYAYSQMRPFPIKNLDGMSNKYTDDFYHYYTRPHCNATMPNCASRYIFCDIENYRCLSKVKINGDCSGFEGRGICLEGVCINGKCMYAEIANSSSTISTTAIAISVARLTILPTTIATIESNRSIGTVAATKTTPTTTIMKQLITSATLPSETTLSTVSIVQKMTIASTISKTTIKQTTTSKTIPTLMTTISGLKIMKTSLLVANHISAISWNKQSPFPVVYFTISIVKGAFEGVRQESRSIARNCRISVTGLNVPSGYTQTVEGTQYRTLAYPKYLTGALVRSMDPSKAGYFPLVEIDVSVTNELGQGCIRFCFQSTSQLYSKCDDEKIKLSSYSAYSDPIVFRKNKDTAQTAKWAGRGYYKKRKEDYLLFQCPNDD